MAPYSLAHAHLADQPPHSSTLHVATFDYDALRSGDRAVCVGEVPYLDPHSTGHKEWEAAVRANATAA